MSFRSSLGSSICLGSRSTSRSSDTALCIQSVQPSSPSLSILSVRLKTTGLLCPQLYLPPMSEDHISKQRMAFWQLIRPRPASPTREREDDVRLAKTTQRTRRPSPRIPTRSFNTLVTPRIDSMTNAPGLRRGVTLATISSLQLVHCPTTSPFVLVPPSTSSTSPYPRFVSNTPEFKTSGYTVHRLPNK